jgi:hypothetical protein
MEHYEISTVSQVQQFTREEGYVAIPTTQALAGKPS